MNHKPFLPFALAISLILFHCGSTSGARDASIATRTHSEDSGVMDRASGVADGATGAVERKLIREAWLELELPHEGIPAAAAQTRNVAKDVGGYVSSERVSEERAEIVLRVPNDRLEEVIETLSRNGRVMNSTINVQDVTQQYMDLEIRIENAEKLKARLQSLLQRTEDVETLLKVETELARVTTELERLEGQMRYLRNRVDLATLTVKLVAEDKSMPGPLGWVFVGLYEGVRWLFVWDESPF